MRNEYAVLVRGFTSQEQADAFIKWHDGQGEQDVKLWFEECGSSAHIDTYSTFPIKTTTILDEHHNEVHVSYLYLRVEDL